MPSRNDPINVIISCNISCNAIISVLNALFLLVEKLTCGNYFEVGVLSSTKFAKVDKLFSRMKLISHARGSST